MPAKAEWITRLAADERKRDDARSLVAAAAARKERVVAAQGQHLLDELRATIARDIEWFRSEFPGDPTREILFESVEADGRFAVRKPRYPAVALTVVPHLSAASLTCVYRFTVANGLPPREERIELLLMSDSGDDTLRVKHHGTGQVFAGADALSEFLLVPVFTGRPRLNGG